MAIVSGDGILEFDSALRRLMAISNRFVAILLSQNGNGNRSERAKGDIGYPVPPGLGDLSYLFWLQFSRPSDRNFNSARVKPRSLQPSAIVSRLCRLPPKSFFSKVSHVRSTQAIHSGTFILRFRSRNV